MNNSKKNKELKRLKMKIKSEIKVKKEPMEYFNESFCDENLNSDSLKPQEQANGFSSLSVKLEVKKCKMEIEHTMDDNYERRMEDVPELKINIKSEIEVKDEPIENYNEGFCDEKNWNSNSLKSQEEANGFSNNNSSSLELGLPIKLEVNKYKMEMEHTIEDDQERRMEDVTEDICEGKKKDVPEEKVVPKETEKKTMNQLISELTGNLLVYYDKDVLITSLFEMKNEDLSLMNSVLRELTARYKFNLKRLNNVKEKKDNDASDEIRKELYNLRVIHEEYNDGSEILNEVKNMIKNDSFSDNDDMRLISENLTKAERNRRSIPLYPSYIKASYLVHMQKYKRDGQIQIQFNLSRSQFHNYTSFYKLIHKYNSLIRINLPFSKIIKYKSKIEKIIEDDRELQNICQVKVPFLKE